jgi:hypothetical protein
MNGSVASTETPTRAERPNPDGPFRERGAYSSTSMASASSFEVFLVSGRKK